MHLPPSLGDLDVPVPSHICLYHHGYADLRRQYRDFLLPAALDEREGIALIGPPGTPQQLLSDLETDIGAALRNARASGRVVLVESERDADAFLNRMREAFDAMLARGVGVVRAAARPMWDAPGFPAPEDHLWLEAQLTLALAARRVVCLCAYDLAEMPDEAITFGGLEAHRDTLFLGQLAHSRRFIDADRYMSERLLRLPWLTPA